MRVLFANLATDFGGGEGWTLRSAQGLRNRGHDVFIAARTGSPFARRAENSELPCFVLPVGIDYHPSTVSTFVRIMKRERIEVVVVHHNKDVRTAGVAAWVLQKPVVHRNGYPILKNTLRHRLTMGFVTRILTNSENIREYYRSFGWLKAPIDLVYNGVQPPETTPETTLRSLIPGVDAHALIALYSGRLTTVKQVDILLRGLSLMEKESPWQLAILGTGSQEQSLKGLAAELELEQRVHFLGFREDAANLAGSADLVVLASRDEGMPNALMEAMVRGIPVASTPVGDVPELLAHGQAGWIIEPNKPESWFSLMQRLEKHPEEASKMGKAGKKHIRECFTTDAMLDGIEASLKHALSSS